nr:uncharacterized protein LOC109158994 [Ipomoea batatas]
MPPPAAVAVEVKNGRGGLPRCSLASPGLHQRHTLLATAQRRPWSAPLPCSVVRRRTKGKRRSVTVDRCPTPPTLTATTPPTLLSRRGRIEEDAPSSAPLVYFDRVQFKGMRVNRTYSTIVGWSAELARKRVKEENKAGSFGRGTVLPRISKPTDVAAATSRQDDQPPVVAEPALNIPSSSVDRAAGILQKLASTVGEFGEAMAEIGKQGTPVNVMRKTFSGLSNMLNVASTIEATSTPTSSQLDDIFFGSESFTMAVDALIFFPVLRHRHYFLICINVKASKLEIIDNKSLVRGVTVKDKYGDCTTLLVTALKEYLALGSSTLFWKVDELTEEVVDMSWKESENYINCGCNEAYGNI